MNSLQFLALIALLACLMTTALGVGYSITTFTFERRIPEELFKSENINERYSRERLHSSIGQFPETVKSYTDFDAHNYAVYFTNFQSVHLAMSYATEKDYKTADMLFNSQATIDMMIKTLNDIAFGENKVVRVKSKFYSDVPDTCFNDVQDAKETDIDCGGECLPCDYTKACVANMDCGAKNTPCTDSKCAFIEEDSVAMISLTFVAVLMSIVTLSVVF